MKLDLKKAAAIGAAVISMMPSWAFSVCSATITADAPDARYTVSGDLITDTYTGLVWKKCPEGLSGAGCATGTALSISWQDALSRVSTVNASPATLGLGLNDWRLPNRNELETLVERRCASPAINETLFPATPSLSFWTSSPYALNATFAWRVGFDSGEVSPLPKLNLLNVRLVRSGL